MKAPSSPNKSTWIIGLIAGALGIIGHLTEVQILTEYSVVLLIVGFLILVVGTTIKAA